VSDARFFAQISLLGCVQLCFTQTLRASHHCLAVPRSASHTCTMPRFTLPLSDPLCISHMPLCLVSPRLAVLHSASGTCPVLHVTLLDCTPLCVSRMPRASLHPAQSDIRPILHVSNHPAWLCTLRLTRAQCLTSPTLAALHSASHTCLVPHITHTVCAEHCVSHTPRASHHSAWLFCALHLTLVPCFTSSMCCASSVFVIYVCRPHRKATRDVARPGGRM